ncbi:SH3-domain binding protein 1, partial [Balamuthia mandrillaris]
LVGNKTTFRLDTPLGKFYLSAKSPTDKNRWTTLLRDSTEIRVEKNKVFGRPIEEVLQNDANSAPQGTKVIVPRVLEMCVNYLTKVIETEGIFRVACVNSLLLSLKAQIDTNIDETDLDAVEDPHAISSLLKCYLRELPEPLLTFEFYEKVILPDLISEETDSKQQLSILVPYLRQVPAAQIQVLNYLLKFLDKVVEHSHVNKMTAYNLAIIFGPSLLRPRQDTIDTSLKSPRVNAVIQTLIEHQDVLLKLQESDELVAGVGWSLN